MTKKSMDIYKLRRILVAVVIVLVVGLTVFNIWLVRDVKQEMVAQQVTSSGEAAIGGDFVMTTHKGENIRFSDTQGKLRLVFFGFTHCPDICPVALLTITNALNTLGDQAKMVLPVFITVDPERDTPEVMNVYIANFHPSLVGLTGSKEETEKATSAFKAYYSVSSAAKNDHGKDAHSNHVQVDHSGFIYLMDREGDYFAHFPHDVDEATLVGTLTPLLSKPE